MTSFPIYQTGTKWSEPLRLDTLEFKRQVVEELHSGESRLAQLCRRYNITSSVLCYWKNQYSRGKFNNELTEEGALRDRIEKLLLIQENNGLPQAKVTES